MKLKKILSGMLVTCLLLSMVPTTVFASADKAYVKWANGTETRYSTFPAAWNAATSSGDKNTVGMLDNWESGRFVVPEGKTLTLELNGYVLTRDRGDSTSDGEVLYASKKSTLRVYGGNSADPSYGSNNTHNVNVYVANADRYDYTRKRETLHGGIINGGNSSDAGGGIHMKESAKVYLYNVTIAGNNAAAKTVEFGDGGGIEMDQAYGYLYMQDSKIIYNAARYDGGGVHVDADYCRIDMVRSRIDHNVADDNGAGIYVEGDHFILKGDAKQIMDPEKAITTYGINDWNGAYNYFPPVDQIGSSISYNCVFDAEDGGGGIYVDNKAALIEGVNIFGNIATDDLGSGNGDGGGIYLDQEDIVVRNCNILRNKADELGGGIYNRGDDDILDVDDNTIDSCSICMNLAWDKNGAGGGICVYRYCDLNISGPLIVRRNVSYSYQDSYYGDNLYLSSDGEAVDAFIIPSTAPGADVHIRLSEYKDQLGHMVSRDSGTYDIRHFTYDNNPSQHIGWNSAWQDRYLRVTNGEKPDPVSAVAFEPLYHERTQSVDVDYNGYAIIKGVVSYPSFPVEDKDIENVFYYSDGFFAGDPNTYNPQLATLSMCLAGAAGYSNEYGTNDRDGGLNSDYLDKSQNFRQFVSDIGCKDEDIYVNDFNLQKPDADTIGVGIASKPIFEGKTLVIIGVRGMGYEKEWISNMSLDANGEANGWSSAATQVMAELKAYLDRKGIDGSSEDTIFWIAGYSRAGATSNLSAKRIVDTYDNGGTHTFAYPLEAPMGGNESAKVAGNNYNCIHNIINQNDIVPWLGTTEMGFIRYGVDHYVPGSADTHSPSDGSDNNKVPEDNTPWDVENVEHPGYQGQKPKMLKQLTAINQDIIFDDYFHQATIDYITGGLGYEDLIQETRDHEDQVGTTEHFIQFFFEKLQEYAFKYQLDGKLVDDYYKNKPRRYFAEYNVSDGRTFQQAVASMAGLIFGKSPEDTDGLIDCFKALMVRMGTWDKFMLYCNIDEDDIDDLKGEIENLWKYLTVLSSEDTAKGYHPIMDYLTDEEYKELSSSFKSLIFPLLCFAGVDYDRYGQDILGTMAYNIPRIIANHYPEVTHAWLRSYDYLYADDTTPIIMSSDAKTGPSGVALEITYANGGNRVVTPSEGEIIEIHADDTVRLIPSDRRYIDTGEAFYYQFTSGQDHSVHAFSDPFRFYDMIRTNSTNGVFTLNVVAAHDGIKLKPLQFSIKFSNASVIVVPEAWDNEIGDYTYSAKPIEVGELYQLSWIDPAIEDQEFRFKRWEAYEYTDDNSPVGDLISEDQYIDLFGWDFDPNSEVTTIENRSSFSVKFIPVYDRIITSMSISFTDGTDLPRYAMWLDDPVEGAKYPISWRYDESSNKYIAEFSVDIPEKWCLAEGDDLTVIFEDPADMSVSLEDTNEAPSGTDEGTTDDEVPHSEESAPADTEGDITSTDEAAAGEDESLTGTEEGNRNSGEDHPDEEGAPSVTEKALPAPADDPADTEDDLPYEDEAAATTDANLTDTEARPASDSASTGTEEPVTATDDDAAEVTEPSLAVQNNNLTGTGYKVYDPRLINVSFSEGRAHFEVEFSADDDGEAISGLTEIHTMDLNLSEEIETLYIDITGMDTVTAPDQRNMQFVKWWNGSTSRTIEASELNGVTDVYAYYRPVVNEINVTLAKMPAGGERLPEMVSTTVTMTNTWKIDNAAMNWQTEDTTAAHDTSYTARITVNKDDLTGTNLSEPGSVSIPLAGAFTLADNITVNVKDEDGTSVGLANYIYSETSDSIILDLVFTTGKKKIVSFTDAGVTVSILDIYSYGISYGIPDEVYAYTEDGLMVSVPVTWRRTQESTNYLDETVTHIIHWEGEYAGDEYSVDEGIIPVFTQTITPIERPASPYATPEAGEYTGVITVTLTADENSDIYYRVVEFIDGEENPLRSPWFYLDSDYTKKYTEPIVLNQYIENDYYLFAYAENRNSGLRSSAVTYRYSLTKPEAIKLEAKAPTIVMDGNIECWYSTRQERIGFDENGDAIFEEVPDQYFADEDCTILLDYEKDVLIPAFVRTSHASSSDDAVARMIKQSGSDNVTFQGLEGLGIQTIGTDGSEARVLTVLDSRIIGAATDYGYLFDTDSSSLTAGSAHYKYSCKGTSNTLYSGDDYCYVTAKIANGFLDPDMNVCFYVMLENGTDYIYTDAVPCEATTDGSAETDSMEDNITADTADLKPEFKGETMILSGQIGLNFFMDLPSIEGVDYATSYMEYTVSGKSQIVPYNSDFRDNEGKGYYGFTCYINSIQMADKITAVFHYGENGSETVSMDYSVAEYLSYFDEHSSDYDDKTLTLIHAIADYGHYAQPFLADTNNWTIGVDHAEMTAHYKEAYDMDGIKRAVQYYAFVKTIEGSKITKVTYKLWLDSETTVDVFLTVEDGTELAATGSFNGKTYEAQKMSDGRYRIRVTGIAADKLGEIITITGTAGSEFTVSVSALSYVRSVMGNDSFNNDAKMAIAALYEYYSAAVAYRNSVH